MAPPTMVTFVRNDVMPSWWANAIQRVVGNLCQITLQFSDTQVVMLGAAGDKASIVNIGGRWRWMENNIVRNHPGGAAGTYALWATTKNNNIVSTPVPGTDLTNYDFDLAFTSSVSTPPTVVPGTVDASTLLCSVVWDGTKMKRVTPLRPGIRAMIGTFTVGTFTVRKTIDASDLTLQELADFVATLYDQVVAGTLRGATL